MTATTPTFTERLAEADSGTPVFDVEVELIGQDGNAFAILGAVQRELRNAGVSAEDISAYHAAATEGDYNHLLRVTTKTVHVS